MSLVTVLVRQCTSATHRRDDTLPRHPDRHFPTAAWVLDSPLAEDASLDAHLQWLLDRLEGKTALRSLVEEGYTVELYSSAFTDASHGTITLSHETLARLGSVPLSVLVATCLPTAPKTP